MGKHIAIFIAVLVVTAASLLAAPIVTSMQLDTENDLQDIGGGSLFNCNPEGNGGSFGGGISGGFPWGVNQGAQLYNNITNDGPHTQWNTTPSPALAGVYGMPMAYRLDGFSITVNSIWQNGYKFAIQGSNDSTNGYEGTWVTIFSNSSYTVTGNSTHRWNSDENTFLSALPYNSFRLAAYNEYKEYAEIEFFGPPVPVSTVIIVK